MLEDDVRELKTLVIGLGGRLDGIDKRLDGMDKRFEGMDKRFDGMDKRFDEVDKRFEAVDTRFAGVDRHLLIADAQFAGINARFDDTERLIKTEFARAATHADSLFEKLRQRIDLYGEQQSGLFESQGRLEKRVTRLETGGRE